MYSTLLTLQKPLILYIAKHSSAIRLFIPLIVFTLANITYGITKIDTEIFFDVIKVDTNWQTAFNNMSIIDKTCADIARCASADSIPNKTASIYDIVMNILDEHKNINAAICSSCCSVSEPIHDSITFNSDRATQIFITKRLPKLYITYLKNEKLHTQNLITKSELNTFAFSNTSDHDIFCRAFLCNDAIAFPLDLHETLNILKIKISERQASPNFEDVVVIQYLKIDDKLSDSYVNRKAIPYTFSEKLSEAYSGGSASQKDKKLRGILLEKHLREFSVIVFDEEEIAHYLGFTYDQNYSFSVKLSKEYCKAIKDGVYLDKRKYVDLDLNLKRVVDNCSGSIETLKQHLVFDLKTVPAMTKILIYL